VIQTLKLVKSLVLVGLLCFLAGCKNVQIVSPTNNSVSNTAPEFRIRFKSGVPETFTATINGVVVDQSLFTVDGNDAFAAVSLAQLKAGDNEFAVTEPTEVKTTFHLDQVGPVIHLLGATGDNPKQVTGYLSDRGGPTSLTLNGTSLPLDSKGAFNASIPAATTYELVATDVYGYVTSESYIRLGERFNPAFAVRINQQGLADSLPDAILQIVESLDFNSFITNPISESCSGAVIADACANFSINNIVLTPGSTVSIQALSGNRLRMNVGLSRLDLDTTARTYARCKSFLCGGDGNIFGTLTFSGVTTVQNTNIAADFIVNVSNGNVSVQIVDGTLDVDLPANGLQVDIDFGAVEDIPFIGDLMNTVVNGIINGLVGILSSIIVNIADGFIAGPVSSLVNSLISNLLPDNIALPVGETTLNIGFSPEGFATSSGGFDLVLASDVEIEANDPDVLPVLGSRFAAGAAPSPYPRQTPGGANADLTATLSANLLNQILSEAYEGGLLDVTLDETNGFSLGSLLAIPDFPLDLVGVEDINIVLKGATAPAVTVLPQASAADGVIALQVLDLTLTINADVGDGNGLQEVLTTTIDLRSPFDLGITADNKLTIGIEGTPDVVVQNFRIKAGGLVISSGNASAIKNLINSIAPQLLPKLLESVGGVPIPSIQGFSLQLLDIWNPNAANTAFLSLAGNLVSAEAMAAAEAPVIAAQAEEQVYPMFATVTQDQRRSATIRLDGYNPEQEPLEYRYRINGGHWTVWKQREQIQLSYLPAGDNQIEVCARTSLLKEDCTSVVVPVPSAQ